MKKIFEKINQIEKLMSTSIPNSEISKINQNAGNHPVKISQDTFNVLSCAKEIAKLGSNVEVTRFKGLGEINPSEFGQFIHPRKEGESEDKGIHLTQVSIQSLKNVPEVLKFYMGKNTPERREFIVHHLASEIDA